MLLNKNDHGADELKELLGFIYQSNSFANIKTDWMLAEEEMAELVGGAVYKLAHDHYNSEDYDSLEPTDAKKLLTELVHKMQLPIAYYAYHSFSPHADVTHSDTGRKIMSTEGEKQAFEWQLERDDKAVLDKAHKTTDRLLAFLDAQAGNANEIRKAWRESQAFANEHALFVNNVADFDSVFPIGSRRLYIKIAPFIKETERKFIIPLLSTEHQVNLRKMIKGDTEGLSEETKLQLTEILDLIRPPLVLRSMATSMRRLAVEVLPEGLFQNYVSERITMGGKIPAATDVRREVAANLDKDAIVELARLDSYLQKIYAPAPDQEVGDLTDRINPDEKFIRL